jgi:DNA-binding transcriptional ArsR family regulator
VGELTAGEVAAAVRLTPSTARRHLRCLKSCGLVESCQEWRYVYYRIAITSTGLLAAAEHVLEDVEESMWRARCPKCTHRDERNGRRGTSLDYLRRRMLLLRGAGELLW